MSATVQSVGPTVSLARALMKLATTLFFTNLLGFEHVRACVIDILSRVTPSSRESNRHAPRTSAPNLCLTSLATQEYEATMIILMANPGSQSSATYFAVKPAIVFARSVCGRRAPFGWWFKHRQLSGVFSARASNGRASRRYTAFGVVTSKMEEKVCEKK